MDMCTDCPKKWECFSPCEKVIDWQDLEADDKITTGQYVNKGVPLYVSSASHDKYRKKKAALGGKNSKRFRSKK